ncbi:MAG TPA: fibronectin type III domain-containing protein [Terriglobales bacterium]
MSRFHNPFSHLLLLLCGGLLAGSTWAQTAKPHPPSEVPARRSTQLLDGFGVNLDLPRDPRLPWTGHWWTQLPDSGVKWVRLGQYENSSEKTGWDWVEQSPGQYEVLPEVDDAVRSLVDNGISIEIQLCYNNPLYQGDPARRPRHIDPAPPSIGQDDKPPNPIFEGLNTEDEIQGFLNYTRFMVDHFKGKVRAWELWNEENIGYWHPDANSPGELIAKARQYGKALCRFADVVHEVDPQSKVIFGGISSVDVSFVQAAIAGCPSKIDVMAYHAYPGFGSNHAPEEANSLVGAHDFREAVLRAPGVRKDIEFWENEWNVSPSWKNSNDSVQARYLARFYLEDKGLGVRGAVWEFVPGTDGNEHDQFGILHGMTNTPDSFQPREAYRSLEVTSALFGQTTRDRNCEVLQDRSPTVPEEYSHGELRDYCFRDQVSGKPIYALWLAVYAAPDDRFQPVASEIPIPDEQIQNPVLIDVRSGKITPAAWLDRKARTIRVELKDSVLAVADASFMDWSPVPEAPWGLTAKRSGEQVTLHWKPVQCDGFEVQQSIDSSAWKTIAHVPSKATSFSEHVPEGGHVSYRVRAVGVGESAWSNPAWVTQAP